MKIINQGFSALALTLFSVFVVASPNPPPANPALADSTFASIYTNANLMATAGPTGPTRTLAANETEWKKIGPMNGWAPMYSGLYPNGKRVMWIGGYDRVAKLDADTLEVLTTYAIGGNTFYGEEEITRELSFMDSADDKTFVDYNLELWSDFMATKGGTFYRLLTRDNELFLYHQGSDGSLSVRVYGEEDATDPSSAINLLREWTFPADIPKARVMGMGINMTFDGWVILVLSDGTMFALSQDFKQQYTLKLPQREQAEGANRDFFAAFVRNSSPVDDQGGIYVVSRDYMHRVQWTGNKLSLDQADGAWSVAYPNPSGNGSGSTPGLMGWGPDEDHLVIIADGTIGNNIMAFWRDDIPEDWQGLPGFDRRVASITPIRFGVSETEQVTIQNSPVIYGYGIYFNNTYAVQPLPDMGNPTRQFLARVFSMYIPGHEGRGGAMTRWDPEQRKLNIEWQTQMNLVSSVCTVSSATNLLYCWGNRNRDWTLEGIDWNTGESVFHYKLGASQRFNTLGSHIWIAPNGNVECGCMGGLGIVRVKPQQTVE